MLHVIHSNGSTVPGTPHNRLTNGIDYLLVLGGLLYCLTAARAQKEQGSEPQQLLLWIKETKSNNGEHNSTLHEEENITQRYMMLDTLDHPGVDQWVISILFGINKWMILGHELERKTRGRERERGAEVSNRQSWRRSPPWFPPWCWW